MQLDPLLEQIDWFFTSNMWLFICHLIGLAWSAGISCSNMHENAINRFFGFFDNFSYINLFILSYRLFSMIYWSLGLFLEFLVISKINKFQKRIYGISTASGWRQQVNWVGQVNPTVGTHTLVSQGWFGWMTCGSTLTWSKSKLTHGVRKISTNLKRN